MSTYTERDQTLYSNSYTNQPITPRNKLRVFVKIIIEGAN